MALSAARLCCVSLLVYGILIPCATVAFRNVKIPDYFKGPLQVNCPPGCVADGTVVGPIRNETGEFIIVPTTKIPGHFGTHTCLDDKSTGRMMINSIQLSKEFRSQFTKHGLSLSNGTVEQKIIVELPLELDVSRGADKMFLIVQIPCVLSLVEFTFYYRLIAQDKAGQVIVQLLNHPTQLTVMVKLEQNGRCSLQWVGSHLDRQLADYTVNTIFNPDDRYDMTPVNVAINKLINDGWLYPSYRAEVRVFIYRIVREAILQNYGLIRFNDLLAKNCRDVIDPYSPIEVPTTPTPPRPTFRPEPTTRTPVWTTQEPGPEIPTPSPPNPGQDCKPINIEVHYNKKKQS